MKKLFVVVLSVLLFAGVCYAKTVYGPKSIHRNAVSSNDTDFPSSTSGAVSPSDGDIEFDNYLVEMNVGGSGTPSWVVTPGFWDGSAYASASQITVNAGYSIYTIPSYGKSIYFEVNGKVGTGPTISIYVTPFTSRTEGYVIPR